MIGSDLGIYIGLGITVIVNVLAIGMAYGSLRSGQGAIAERTKKIEQLLGLSNGQDGVFVRRSEMTARVESAHADHERYEAAITALQERLSRDQG